VLFHFVLFYLVFCGTAIFPHFLPCWAHQEVMNDSAATTIEPTALPFGVRRILRIEGLAIAVLTAVLYARTGASWWLFAALWLVPDLSMLGYLVNACWGARIYNSVHTYATPITLGVCALLTGAGHLVPFALIWANHIAVDRLLGYGLKYPLGYGWTHLGQIGRARAIISPPSPSAER
jgi:hypothetical protein